MAKREGISPLMQRSEMAVRNYLGDEKKWRSMDFDQLKLHVQRNDPWSRRYARECRAAHKDFIATIAKYYHGRLDPALGKEVLLDSLLSWGDDGLSDVLRWFEPSPHLYHFATYALWWIRKGILRSIEMSKERVAEERKYGPSEVELSHVDGSPYEGPPYKEFKYKNKNGEEVLWDGLTAEERREYEEKGQRQKAKKQRQVKEEMNKDIKEHFSEFVYLLSAGMEISEAEATRDLELLLEAEK